jgi:hypothetical protein
VTIPAGVESGGRHDPYHHGDSDLSVALWSNGIVLFHQGGHGFRTRDGGLGTKFGWRRGVTGKLKITGRRLDAAAPPLRAHIPFGYGERGFQSTYIIFPTTGCWEVTGKAAEASLTFVTQVERLGTGPTAYDDQL